MRCVESLYETGLIAFLKTITANVSLDCGIDLIFLDVLTQFNVSFVASRGAFIAAANFEACFVLVKHVEGQ